MKHLNKQQQFLTAIDFDLTIKYHDSGLKMGLAHHFPGDELPKSVLKVLEDEGWDRFKEATFEAVNGLNLTKDEIVQGLNADGGMIDRMEEVVKLCAKIGDVIIVSDSTTVFIETFMEHHGLSDQILEIFAQPATITDDGKILSEEPPEAWRPTGCDFAGRRMCKAKVLQHFLDTSDKTYDRIVYIGDGPNDFCPVKEVLDKNDLVFPRIGYKLNNILKERGGEVDAPIFPWESGKDILKVLKTEFEK